MLGEKAARAPSGDDWYHAVFSGAPVPLAIVDGDLTILEVNAAMGRLLGRDIGQIVGQRISMLAGGREGAAVLAAAADAISDESEAQSGMVEQVEHTFTRRDGSTGWAVTAMRRVHAPGGRPVLVCTTEDVTTGRMALEQQRREAELDPLTGLLNRRGGDRRLRSALGRVPAGGPLALLLCDADGFKDINDRYGHAAGDTALVSLAARLRGVLRSGDEVIRMGGDEFLVMARVANVEEAVAIAERCVQVIDSPVVIGSHNTRVTLSVGVAIVNPADCPLDVSDVMVAADAALYRAKRQGRNRWVLASCGYGPRGKAPVEGV